MSRINTTYEYSKIRKYFGKQPLFQSVAAHIVDSINPDKNDQKLYCLRNPVNQVVQATLPQSNNETNTRRIRSHNQGINHTEGGWPRDVNVGSEEQIHRHQRRVCQSEHYINTVLNLAPVIEHYIDQNNAIEMYQTYFEEIPPRDPIELYKIRVANKLSDTSQRPVSCIRWTNENPAKLAIAYCYKEYKFSYPSKMLNAFYLWNVEKQNTPANILQPPYPCWQLACSPENPNVLIGGLENGTVCLFDVRNKEEAISTSALHVSHRDPVTALVYTHSRTNTEFFSGSYDGQCLWWDTRNLSQPLDNLSMCIRIRKNEEANPSNAEGISALQYDHISPTRFLCGTETGFVINVNRLGRNISEVLVSNWNAHAGPVHSIHRSPCVHRMFLTCGDFSVRIWSEEIRMSPIIISRPYRHEVNDACWAPLRCSSYMSIGAKGIFYYWDLLRKQHEPTATKTISKHALTKISPHTNGKIIAIGDNIGDTFFLELSENMIYPGASDKQLMQQIYEREKKREHILEIRVKEILLKIRGDENVPIIEDENIDLKATEEEYWKIVKNELELFEETMPIKNNDL